MAVVSYERVCNDTLLPAVLYSSTTTSANTARTLALLVKTLGSSTSRPEGGGPDVTAGGGGRKMEPFSPAYYAACAIGGAASCGLTHAAVTALDIVKCNMQIDPEKYKSIACGFSVLFKEQGIRGFFRGWSPTLLGYSAQGAFKFGLYEFFKKCYSNIVSLENADKYKTLVYLAGSASAELIADVVLCPMEAVKVRVQTQSGFACGITDGLPKLIRCEGVLGLYKGLVPLWGRQIPYTMMKFATFENIVELIYSNFIRTPKNRCSKRVQLAVSIAGGYAAGVLCAIVSHPADNLVSYLNNAKGATIADAVNKLGLRGLCTRGLLIRILMIGTLTGAQWGIYDAFKVFAGLPTTGGVTPAALINPIPAAQPTTGGLSKPAPAAASSAPLSTPDLRIQPIS